MKRLAVACGVLLALAASMPAHAGGTVTGTVRLPAANPTVPRTLYQMSPASNGATGYVFKLSAASNGKTFTLRLLSGATGAEILDIYFYADIGGAGTPCPVPTGGGGSTQTGTISCPAGLEPAWGIVVLRAGFDARFRFTY